MDFKNVESQGIYRRKGGGKGRSLGREREKGGKGRRKKEGEKEEAEPNKIGIKTDVSLPGQ